VTAEKASAMESVAIRQRGGYDFAMHYDHLCALNNTCPLPAVKAHLAQGQLDINADRIRYVCCAVNGVAEMPGWLGSRVVSVLDSGSEEHGFKSHSRRCQVTVLGKLFTPIVPLFTKQQNW